MQHARLCTLLEKPLPDVTLSKRPSWQHLQTYAAKVGVLLGRVGKDRSSVSVGDVQMLARSAMGYVLRLSPKGGGDFYRVQQAVKAVPVLIRDLLEVADRKSVVSGKSVSVRVDLGCRGIIKKKKMITTH